MMTSTTPLTLLLLSLATLSNAQIIRRRRSFAGRIVGAVVAGIVCIVALSILFFVIARRRRLRNAYNSGNVGFTPQPQYQTQKPMFGGPWGRTNGAPPQQQAPGPPHAQSYNQEVPPPYNNEQQAQYPPPMGPPPPPAHTAPERVDNGFVGGFRT